MEREGPAIHKIYLSAILNLYDRRIVPYVTSKRNDNPLVFKTFDKVLQQNPGAAPLFHSDRGFQYTNRALQAGTSRHEAEHVPGSSLHRQRTYGRLLGHTEARTLVW